MRNINVIIKFLVDCLVDSGCLINVIFKVGFDSCYDIYNLF